MGRKRLDSGLSATVMQSSVAAIRRGVAVQYGQLLTSTGTDLGELAAQAHAADMIEGLVGFAMDPTLPAEFRRACMNDVLDRAMGKPTERSLSITQTQGIPEKNGEVQLTLDAAKRNAALYVEINRWVGQVPFEQWTQEVKDAVEGGEAFAEADSKTK